MSEKTSKALKKHVPGLQSEGNAKKLDVLEIAGGVSSSSSLALANFCLTGPRLIWLSGILVGCKQVVDE